MHLHKRKLTKREKNKIFKQTIHIYSNAVWFVVNVIDENYSSLEDLTSKQKYNFIEVGKRSKYYKNTDDAIIMTLEF